MASNKTTATFIDSARIIPATFLMLVALVIGSPFAIYIFNHFYGNGAYFFDSGWLSYLLSRFEMPPANPISMADEGLPFYFTYHIALLMPLWGAIAQVAHLDSSSSFAAYQWIFHALLFFTGFVLARNHLAEVKASWWFCLFFATALTYSPITIGAMSLPHTEIAIPILFLTFCTLLSSRNFIVASFVFLIILLVREDAGFHVFSFLMSYATLEAIQRRTLPYSVKLSLAFAIIGCFYSAMTFLLQHLYFPDFSLFVKDYAGTRLFEHVSFRLFQDRISNLALLRPELFVIAGLPITFSIMRRDLAQLSGTIAVLPWIAFNATSFSMQIGFLHAYYAFPFLVTLAWPWALGALRKLDGKSVGPQGGAIRDQIVWSGFWILSTCIYFTTPLSSDPHWAELRRSAALNFFPQVTVAEVAQVNHFAKVLGIAIQKGSSPIIVDDAMLSLIAGQAGAAHKFDGAANGKRGALPSGSSGSFVLVYFDHSVYAPNIWKSPFPAAAEFCFGVRGTNIRVLVRGDVTRIAPELTPMLSVMGCKSRPP